MSKRTKASTCNNRWPNAGSSENSAAWSPFVTAELEAQGCSQKSQFKHQGHDKSDRTVLPEAMAKPIKTRR